MQIFKVVIALFVLTNVLLNIFVLVSSFLFATTIQGWQYGILISFSFLALILSSINIMGVELFYIFPGHKAWAVISTILIIVMGGNWFLGEEFIKSITSWKDSILREWVFDKYVDQSRLETFKIPVGTPLYVRKGDDVVFEKKLPSQLDQLEVRGYPETVDIKGIIYKRVIFPTKRNGQYVQGAWDSQSEHYLIDVVSLKKIEAEVIAKPETQPIKPQVPAPTPVAPTPKPPPARNPLIECGRKVWAVSTIHEGGAGGGPRKIMAFVCPRDSRILSFGPNGIEEKTLEPGRYKISVRGGNTTEVYFFYDNGFSGNQATKYHPSSREVLMLGGKANRAKTSFPLGIYK